MVSQELHIFTNSQVALNDYFDANNKILDKSTKKITFQQLFTDKMLMIKVIKNGVSTALFLSIKNALPFTELEWCNFLNISLKSMQRYKKDESYIFKSIHSEKILELTEVTSLGFEVFESKSKFYLWLNTPSFALANMKPLELLNDSYGKELVMDELNRIEHGIFV